MRVWDISPGYLNRQSLLGEHRELHGIYIILSEGKTGYSRHPETLRWSPSLDGLVRRHSQLVAEMRLRGYVDRTPLPDIAAPCRWPRTFVTDPVDQFAVIRRKYAGGERGRIPLPRCAHQLWAQHKYSVMARSVATCQRIGRAVARKASSMSMIDLAHELVTILRERPDRPRLVNAVEHMWGHVRPYAGRDEIARFKDGPTGCSLAILQALAMRFDEPYLVCSTALSDLAVYCVDAG